MTIKQKAHQLIDSLPEELTARELEDAFYSLIEQLKIDEGLQASADGQTISHDEMRQRMSRWTSK